MSTEWNDLFHEDVPFEFIDQVFAIMALCPRHVFQVLTKRPERLLSYLYSERTGPILSAMMHRDPSRDWSGWPLPNVYLGVSVENQDTADRRIPLLLRTPSVVRFVSYEPALGGVTFRSEWLRGYDDGPVPRIDWIIIGGESGPNARPFNLQWARDVIAQCKAAGVACFVKQLGARPYESERQPIAGYKCNEPAAGSLQHRMLTLRDPNGGDPEEWPEDLRVREFPR